MVLSQLKVLVLVVALCTSVCGIANAQPLLVDTHTSLTLRVPTLTVARSYAAPASLETPRLSLSPLFSLYLNAGIGPWSGPTSTFAFPGVDGVGILARSFPQSDSALWFGFGASFRIAENACVFFGLVTERSLLTGGFSPVAPIVGASFRF